MRPLHLLTYVSFIILLSNLCSYVIGNKSNDTDLTIKCHGKCEYQAKDRNFTPSEVQKIMDKSKKTLDFIKTFEVRENEETTTPDSIRTSAKANKGLQKQIPKEDSYDPGWYPMNGPIVGIEQWHPSDMGEPLQSPAENTYKKFSPVTLDQSWAKQYRLIFVVLSACTGTVLNGFFVASFFVERSLNGVEYVFLACIGFSDMLMTSGVMPMSTVVLLSGQWDNLSVCNTMYFFAEISCYCNSLFFLLLSLQTHIRLFYSRLYAWIGSAIKSALVVSVYLLSGVLAAIGVFMELDGDYCQRKHSGNATWRLATGLLFHYIPGILTISILIFNFYAIKTRARKHPSYKRSHMYERDHSMAKLNLIAYVLYAVIWLPYIYVINFYPDATNSTFYYSAWFGVIRTIFTPLVYCCFNKSFACAFSYLCQYCCFKSDVSSNNRQRRGTENRTTSVHIMHHAVGAMSPQRSASSAQELLELRV